MTGVTGFCVNNVITDGYVTWVTGKCWRDGLILCRVRIRLAKLGAQYYTTGKPSAGCTGQ